MFKYSCYPGIITWFMVQSTFPYAGVLGAQSRHEMEKLCNIFLVPLASEAKRSEICGIQRSLRDITREAAGNTFGILQPNTVRLFYVFEFFCVLPAGRKTDQKIPVQFLMP